jgi:hypothetical protein
MRTALALALATALAGCDGKEGSGAAGNTGPREVRSNAGRYTVTFTPSPDPIPMNQLFDLSFRVASKQGSKEPAKVEVDARMPAHGHGMNRVPRITRLPDGTFKAEGMLFHMPGHWELYFDVTEGGTTERAQVDVHLK